MNKKLSVISLIIVLFLSTITIIACSKSNNDDIEKSEEHYKNLIIGKWEIISKSGLVATHVDYKSNGTFSYTSTKEWDYEEHGKYQIEGNILYELFSDEEEWSMNNINLLNSISLIIQNLDDEGKPYGKPISFQRIE